MTTRAYVHHRPAAVNDAGPRRYTFHRVAEPARVGVATYRVAR